ncbi:MAG: hypothetical protein ACODAQ_07375 [Phycisphaeraceae bacterium]
MKRRGSAALHAMLPTNTEEPSPPQALRMARVLWSGLLGGQAVFAALVVWLVVAGQVPRTPNAYPMLMYVALGALAVLTPLAYFLRNQIYKASWREHAVSPRGYVGGNLILMVLLEAAGFIAFMAVLVIGALMPTVLIGAAALAVQFVNFPTGTPMRPRGPAIGERQDTHEP